MTFRHLRNVRGFFSDYYLGSIFGRTAGRTRRRQLSNRGTDFAYVRFRRLRERAEGRAQGATNCRERFLRPLLRDVLGFHLGAGDERIHGLFANAEDEASGGAPLLVAWCGVQFVDAPRQIIAAVRADQHVVPAVEIELRRQHLVPGRIPQDNVEARTVWVE